MVVVCNCCIDYGKRETMQNFQVPFHKTSTIFQQDGPDHLRLCAFGSHPHDPTVRTAFPSSDLCFVASDSAPPHTAPPNGRCGAGITAAPQPHHSRPSQLTRGCGGRERSYPLMTKFPEPEDMPTGCTRVVAQVERQRPKHTCSTLSAGAAQHTCPLPARLPLERIREGSPQSASEPSHSPPTTSAAHIARRRT